MIWITGFQFRYADVRWPMYTGKKFKKVFKNRKKWNRRNDTIYGKYISGRGTPRLQKIIEISITFWKKSTFVFRFVSWKILFPKQPCVLFSAFLNMFALGTLADDKGNIEHFYLPTYRTVTNSLRKNLIFYKHYLNKHREHQIRRKAIHFNFCSQFLTVRYPEASINTSSPCTIVCGPTR